MLKFVSLLVLLFAVACALALPTKEDVKIQKNANWRVAGGDDAPEGAYPFMVSLRGLTGRHTCGGSIINNRWVISAAHCAVGASEYFLTLVAGTNLLTSGGIGYALDSIVAHPQYNSLTLENDILLIQTSRPFEFDDHIQPIALPTSEVGAAEEVTLIGWGATSEAGVVPNELQYVKLKTISYEECASVMDPKPVYESQICTLVGTGEGACSGDLGGPLVQERVLVGVVSLVNPCGLGFSDVYTRVSYYVPWINESVGDNK